MCLIGIIIWEFGFEFIDIIRIQIFKQTVCVSDLFRWQGGMRIRGEKQRMKGNRSDRPVAK